MWEITDKCGRLGCSCGCWGKLLKNVTDVATIVAVSCGHKVSENLDVKAEIVSVGLFLKP